MIGTLSEKETEELLRQEVVGRIACCAEDFIYLVPISYAYDSGSIYAHSLEGTKLGVMRKNPNVCFEVDDVRDMTNWKSVIAWGLFEEITGKEEKEKALKILLSRHLPLSASVTTHLGNAWPFSEDETEDIGGVFYRIVVTKQTGKFEQTSFIDPSRK